MGHGPGSISLSTIVDSFLQAVDEIRDPETDVKRAVDLIEMFRLPWEVVPSEMLTKPEIWTAMIPNLGIGALVRNLGRLTANGTLKPMSGRRGGHRLAAHES